jgi:hypothetical protein
VDGREDVGAVEHAGSFVGEDLLRLIRGFRV